jgi:RNA polymerase sigma-70 factor, ECF subfamily
LDRKFLNSEAFLIRRLRKGDKQAFELIFNEYKEKLYYFSLGYLHSAPETEEVIQNVFISLWENRDDLKEEATLKNFLYKMTVNQIFNYFKHQAVRQKYLNHVSLMQSLEDDHSQQSIFYNDLKEIIDNLIEDMPIRQQVIFKLSRQEGLSHNEIAVRLGLSVRSVENQIYRAIKYIKENLGEEYIFTQ